MKVSVIVTTLNSARTLDACLHSIVSQTYSDIELLVIDNFSSDRTAEIAAKYSANFHQTGPERSAQRNFGIKRSTGDFVLIVDSDMILEKNVVEQCVALWKETPSIIAIPEISFGEGFWAKCKAFERSFYVSDALTSAARFFERSVLTTIGGYDESLNAGEDWDLSIRAEQLRPLRIVSAWIHHDEGRLRLLSLVKKKFYYGASLGAFIRKHGRAARVRLTPMRPSLVANLTTIARRPTLGTGLIVMKTLEMSAGILGVVANLTRRGNRKC